jgi:hypothetical protein
MFRNKIVGHIKSHVLYQCKLNNVSNLTLMTNIDGENGRDLMNSMEDARNCTFANNVVRIEVKMNMSPMEIMDNIDMQRNDGLNEDINGVWMTPNFHQSFDLRGFSDYKMLKAIL